MTTFEQWKIARFAFNNAAKDYDEACQAVQRAGAERGAAWADLVAAAAKLTPEEQQMARDLEYGHTLTSHKDTTHD